MNPQVKIPNTNSMKIILDNLPNEKIATTSSEALRPQNKMIHIINKLLRKVLMTLEVSKRHQQNNRGKQMRYFMKQATMISEILKRQCQTSLIRINMYNKTQKRMYLLPSLFRNQRTLKSIMIKRKK